MQNLNVKNFANSGIVELKSTLNTKGFINAVLADFTIKDGGKLVTMCDEKSQKGIIAQNAGGFLTLLKGGSLEAKSDFLNAGILRIEGGEFSTAQGKALKNQNGVIALKEGIIAGTLENGGNIALSGGKIQGKITNLGGVFTIKGGDFGTDSAFYNNVAEYKGAESSVYFASNLVIQGGGASIATLENSANNGHKSTISIEGGKFSIKNLTNKGNIFAFGGILEVQNLLNNDGGTINAYRGAKIIAQNFVWGNGAINFINGNSGDLEIAKIEQITENKSILNMDFSNKALNFGEKYLVIKTPSDPQNRDKITIKSNIMENLADSANLKFSTTYEGGFIAVSANLGDYQSPITSILSKSALNALSDLVNQANLVKNIDSHEVLSHLLSNPAQVASEIRASNEILAKASAKSAQGNFSALLSTLNRLNKMSAPSKVAFDNTARFAATRTKNPLIKFASFNAKNAESRDSANNALLQDSAPQVQKTQNLQNNIYASILGAFGSFDDTTMGAYGLLAGYDLKIAENIILGANFSYINTFYTHTKQAHNIAINTYGRTFFQDNEIDFVLNLGGFLGGYEYNLLNHAHSADFASFLLGVNATYGYLFNIFKMQFFKPFIGLNFYYTHTPKYAERGKYARQILTQNNFEISVDLGAEHRVFFGKNHFLFAQVKFEQFILSGQSGIFVDFGGAKVPISRYGGFRNYIQILLGGDFMLIKDTLNLIASAGYKTALIKGKINAQLISEHLGTLNIGVKYLF